MNKTIIWLIVVISLLPSSLINAQNINDNKTAKNKFYFDVYIGTQISGIRKEDRISSNFSPYLQLSIGKWISPNISVAINYQGPYFKFIGDNYNHKFLYLNGDLVINLTGLILKNRITFWQIYIAGGAGYFYNSLQEKSSLCLNASLINVFNINENYAINLKFGGIGGWKIYQHDKDALPNLSIGLTRKF